MLVKSTTTESLPLFPDLLERIEQERPWEGSPCVWSIGGVYSRSRPNGVYDVRWITVSYCRFVIDQARAWNVSIHHTLHQWIEVKGKRIHKAGSAGHHRWFATREESIRFAEWIKVRTDRLDVAYEKAERDQEEDLSGQQQDLSDDCSLDDL